MDHTNGNLITSRLLNKDSIFPPGYVLIAQILAIWGCP